MSKLEQLKQKYYGRFKYELFESCIPFWIQYGRDEKNGGVINCLDREGKIFSEDKSVWMQGRCGWLFAWLCSLYGVKDEWLAASKSCLDFMEQYCINPDAEGRMYFTVTADGRPLRQRRYYFSESFYAIANAEYYALTGEKVYLDRAKQAYELYWGLFRGLIDDPVGMGPKNHPRNPHGPQLGPGHDLPEHLLRAAPLRSRPHGGIR